MEYDIIDDYYQKIKHYKIALPYIKDINLLLNCINTYEFNNLSEMLWFMTDKYEKQLIEISKYGSGITVFEGKNVYAEKTLDTLINDAFYIIRCIVMLGAVKCGIEHSIGKIMVKLKSLNYDLYES